MQVSKGQVRDTFPTTSVGGLDGKCNQLGAGDVKCEIIE